MYAKFALTALFVCSLYNSAYSSLLECGDTDNPGELVTSIVENNPAHRRFSLRAPEDGETVTPITCILFESLWNTYHVEIVDGGLGENFVELDVYAIDDEDDDDDDDRRVEDDESDEDDEFALAYRFSVFREYESEEDDDDDDRRHVDDDEDRPDDDDDDDNDRRH